jgi:hypothetical protein
VLSVDADAKRVKIESYSVRVGHGEEGKEEKEPGLRTPMV